MSKSERKGFSRRGFVKTAVTMPVLLVASDWPFPFFS